jgi:hypothetical protein
MNTSNLGKDITRKAKYTQYIWMSTVAKITAQSTNKQIPAVYYKTYTSRLSDLFHQWMVQHIKRSINEIQNNRMKGTKDNNSLNWCRKWLWQDWTSFDDKETLKLGTESKLFNMIKAYMKNPQVTSYSMVKNSKFSL